MLLDWIITDLLSSLAYPLFPHDFLDHTSKDRIQVLRFGYFTNSTPKLVLNEDAISCPKHDAQCAGLLCDMHRKSRIF